MLSLDCHRRRERIRIASVLQLGLFAIGLSLAVGDHLFAQSDTPSSETQGESQLGNTPQSDAEQGRVISVQAQASLIVNVTIAASMPGEIARIDVHEGQPVSLGQSLARLDDALAKVELIASERALEGAELQASNDVDARFASRTLDVRIRELEQSENANQKYAGTVSETELERLRLVVMQSRLGIEQAEHEQRVALAMAGEKQAAADAAAVRLKKHGIIAPQDAIVAEIFVQVGQRVDAGEPIARLIDLESLKVECLVDSESASQTLAGDLVAFHFDDDQVCRGKIEFVSSEIQPVTGQVRIFAIVRNPDRKLRPGTRGRLIGIESDDKSGSSAAK